MNYNWFYFDVMDYYSIHYSFIKHFINNLFYNRFNSIVNWLYDL